MLLTIHWYILLIEGAVVCISAVMHMDMEMFTHSGITINDGRKMISACLNKTYISSAVAVPSLVDQFLGPVEPMLNASQHMPSHNMATLSKNSISVCPGNYPETHSSSLLVLPHSTVYSDMLCVDQYKLAVASALDQSIRSDTCGINLCISGLLDRACSAFPAYPRMSLAVEPG